LTGYYAWTSILSRVEFEEKKMKILLAWQKWETGDGKHLRRYDPDEPAAFHGFQSQNPEALKWMEDAGNPIWPDCLSPIGTMPLFSDRQYKPFEEIQ
jgi:hypothetical protein